jgi:hypothetical protein
MPVLPARLSVQHPEIRVREGLSADPEVRALFASSEKGEIPACAEFCPTGATVFGKVDDLLAEAKKRLQYKPGSQQVYPVERLGGKVTTERAVTPYVQKVYGEKDGGGTQILYLAGVPFDKLGLPKLEERSDAQRSEVIQHTIYKGMIAPIVFLGGLLYVVHKNTKDHK